MSGASEKALSRLLKHTFEGGVFPSGTTQEDRKLLNDMKLYLSYRIKARNRSDPKAAYEHERNELRKYAWEIANLKTYGFHSYHDAAISPTFEHTVAFSEAMDVLSTMMLGAKHTWLERELKEDRDYITRFMKEWKDLKGAK